MLYLINLLLLILKYFELYTHTHTKYILCLYSRDDSALIMSEIFFYYIKIMVNDSSSKENMLLM